MKLYKFELALTEKDVENLYRQYLAEKFGDIIFTSPFGCDGFGESKKFKIRLMAEFKKQLELSLKVNQVKVLCQAIYYVKKFEIAGKVLPSVIFVGDKNECFVIHTNDIFGYLGMDLDWNIAPSDAHTNIKLVSMLMDDEKIAPHVFSTQDIEQCIDKIKDLTDGVKRLIPITPHNVTEVFKHFEDKVVGKHKLDTNQMANLFVQLLVNPDENYLHPVARRKTVVTKAFNEVNLKSREAFTSFFSHFSREYTPKQREHLTAVVDRLVQDVTRRKQGEFFTPTIWVDKAHQYISSAFGDDWKEKYVVWDPAWGTGNLTRDYKFKKLYVSTLIYSDIDTANQMGYNPEAKKFQYDFLNDDYDFLPAELRKSMENKEDMLFLFNPPYATGSNFGETDKKDASKTVQNSLMISEGWGKSSQNLYAQFLFRVFKLKEINPNIKIALFSPSLFLTGTSFVEFRKKFNNSFGFKNGFLFEAKHFSEVSEDWGINFVCYDNFTNQNKVILDVIDTDKNFELNKIGEKEIYNLDNGFPANNWIREKIKKTKTNSNLPQMKSSLVVYSGNKKDGAYIENSLGYFLNASNCVDKNSQQVAMWSVGFYNGHGVSVTEDNFKESVSLFAARKVIKKNWINSKDEYMRPNITCQSFEKFFADSVIISLFHIHAYQTSIRLVDSKIRNNFFWMSKEEMVNMANIGNYPELYNDARTDSDRYVYNLLFGEQRIYDQLSDEAKDVLDSATNLVRLSFVMRRNFADDTNHLNSWDAGYAQLKLLWKEYFPEQFKEFRDKYKVLEDKMRPMVYELGFLLK